jgi:regulatory protein
MIKQLTEQRLFNITLYYLSRYEATSQKVRFMLKRRILKMKRSGSIVPDETERWIENIILKMQNLGYLNDRRYAENQVRILSGQNRSNRFIIGKLKQAGLSEQLIQDLLSETESNEIERARKFAQRKKLGNYNQILKTPEQQKKEMAIMARAGFSYDTICLILNDNIFE